MQDKRAGEEIKTIMVDESVDQPPSDSGEDPSVPVTAVVVEGKFKLIFWDT